MFQRLTKSVGLYMILTKVLVSVLYMYSGAIADRFYLTLSLVLGKAKHVDYKLLQSHSEFISEKEKLTLSTVKVNSCDRESVVCLIVKYRKKVILVSF